MFQSEGFHSHVRFLLFLVPECVAHLMLIFCEQFCNKVWGPPKEELERRAMVEDGNARLLDLLIQKYERKRWHCEPTTDMYTEARKANMSTSSCRQIETSVVSHSPQAVSSFFQNL